MLPAKLAFACILSLLGRGGPGDARCNRPYYVEIANAVADASAAFDVDSEVVVAVIYHESRFKQYAIGPYKEVGLMQLKRGGALLGAEARLPNRVLFGVHRNVWIGTRHLSTFAHRCERPIRYLTPYNGGHCVPSNYSRSVMKQLHAAQRSARAFAIDRSATCKRAACTPTLSSDTRSSSSPPEPEVASKTSSEWSPAPASS